MCLFMIYFKYLDMCDIIASFWGVTSRSLGILQTYISSYLFTSFCQQVHLISFENLRFSASGVPSGVPPNPPANWCSNFAGDFGGSP